MLKNIRIVLVKPKGSGNIGSVARAMMNSGFKDLAIVGAGRIHSFSARAMAVHAREILQGARKFDTLREAVADCGLVVGTTCRGGLYRSHSRLPREVAPKIVSTIRTDSRQVALVFGPEDHGLSNRDLKYCQWLITIPTNQDYPSLNLAQAVMVCLYEIFLASLKSLLKIGFLDSQNPEHILLAIRRILGRAGLEEKDVHILNGLFRQIEWYSDGGWRVTQEKERRGLKIR